MQPAVSEGGPASTKPLAAAKKATLTFKSYKGQAEKGPEAQSPVKKLLRRGNGKTEAADEAAAQVRSHDMAEGGTKCHW